ncbi:hypothetical protein H5410_062181 [Solanum commersonii]|uniref:Uncharacterized protein n=1 Tax=Solanum commersonii TaxID=4109 RepID=A0A9J5WAS3_SOLCO|nr:hypothetical protein H5410_062181 [Solanum commersonii]
MQDMEVMFDVVVDENSNEITDNSSDVEVLQKVRFSLFWLLRGTLFPNKSGITYMQWQHKLGELPHFLTSPHNE